MSPHSRQSFSAWLGGQLSEKRMSQRQLAAQSGVDHSTISRLLSDDRTPSLETAVRLARGLREINDDSEGLAYFAFQSRRPTLPTARVEYALRGDPGLNEADVGEVMRTYLGVRRSRADGLTSKPA